MILAKANVFFLNGPCDRRLKAMTNGIQIGRLRQKMPATTNAKLRKKANGFAIDVEDISPPVMPPLLIESLDDEELDDVELDDEEGEVKRMLAKLETTGESTRTSGSASTASTWGGGLTMTTSMSLSTKFKSSINPPVDTKPMLVCNWDNTSLNVESSSPWSAVGNRTTGTLVSPIKAGDDVILGVIVACGCPSDSIGQSELPLIKFGKPL